MEQEQISETVFLDVFTSLKQSKQQSYLTQQDFVAACSKYKPKCLDGYYDDQDTFTQLCETMFTNMIEAS